MTSGFVMLAMGDLPGEIWDKQSRVAYPAHGVVEDFAWRERLMAALMSQDPQTSAKETLHEGVGRPEPGPERCGGNVFRCDESICEIEYGGYRRHIPNDISQSPETRALEAMLGNGLVDLADCVVRELEGIAVCVDKLSRRGSIFRSERRQ